MSAKLTLLYVIGSKSTIQENFHKLDWGQLPVLVVELFKALDSHDIRMSFRIDGSMCFLRQCVIMVIHP